MTRGGPLTGPPLTARPRGSGGSSISATGQNWPVAWIIAEIDIWFPVSEIFVERLQDQLGPVMAGAGRTERIGPIRPCGHHPAQQGVAIFKPLRHRAWQGHHAAAGRNGSCHRLRAFPSWCHLHMDGRRGCGSGRHHARAFNHRHGNPDRHRLPATERGKAEQTQRDHCAAGQQRAGRIFIGIGNGIFGCRRFIRNGQRCGRRRSGKASLRKRGFSHGCGNGFNRNRRCRNRRTAVRSSTGRSRHALSTWRRRNGSSRRGLFRHRHSLHHRARHHRRFRRGDGRGWRRGGGHHIRQHNHRRGRSILCQQRG